MNKRFVPRVPKKPIFKRETYKIPKSYERAYCKAGITSLSDMVMLFHLTQFGGFRTKKSPNEMYFDEKFLNTWFKQKCEKGYYHFKASAKFLKQFGNLKLKPLEKIWLIQFFSHKEMEECGYLEQEILESYHFLDKLNDFYSSLRVSMQFPQTGITAKDRIQLSRFHAIPFLVKKPKAGGRFFHPGNSYQRISSSLRSLITINGKKTSELDLSGTTLQFFNICLEKHSLRLVGNKLFFDGDPYQYFLSEINSDGILSQYEEKPFNREDLKDILYTAIYSSANRQRSNVNRKLRLEKRNYRYSDLASLFPEFFDSLTELKSKVGVPLHRVINKEESVYTQKVLEKGCLEERMPLLPIHDSFITFASKINKLKEIMNYTSKKLYGGRLIYKQKY